MLHDKAKLIDEILKKRRTIASVSHECTGVNPPVQIKFTSGETVEVSNEVAKELQAAHDASELKIEDLLDSLG